MDHSFFWMLTAAYAAHVLEEYTLDWRGWARDTLGFPVDWPQFYVVNAAVIVGGVCFSMIGWNVPALSLMFPALAAINAVFFHLAPLLVKRRFSPGVFTAVALFLPLAFILYRQAHRQGLLDAWTLAVSLSGGIGIMAFPVILLKLRPLLVKNP
ncbi:MAG: HXXEE domain-containing protein [Spirochaetes bacterium]|nr:HXXEE domain-containing protein [Spirochaetota bacterium]